MHGRDVARKVISDLMKSDSSLLSDDHKAITKEVINDINKDLLPSEVHRLSEQLKRKRMSAEGLNDNELGKLMNRIGIR